MADPIDHESLAISRLATQFRESKNLIDYIKVLVQEAIELEQTFQDLLNLRWIDTAVGVQLDIIGIIVGQPRTLFDSTAISYFGLSPVVAGKGFGDLNNPSVGGRFRSVEEPTTGDRLLTDIEYRAFIRARIIKNRTSSTVQDVIDSVKFILQDSGDVTITEDFPNVAYTVAIGRPLNDNEKVFIKNTDIVPKTAGVTASYADSNGPF